MSELIHYSGLNNYLKHTFVVDNKSNKFNTEVLDVPMMGSCSLLETFNTHLSARPGATVEVLYSGGMDSELVLLSCLRLKINVIAMTMRLMVNGYPINTHDLYYSEKFCRENNVKQTFIDLKIDTFFKNGNHLRYLDPYLITEPHVATHFWLVEQCTHFPVIGGDYCWPHQGNGIISPYRHSYCFYDKFMLDNGINGIGNMGSHSLDSNIFFMQTHLAVLKSKPEMETDYAGIPIFKQAIAEQLGFNDTAVRMRSYGWETISYLLINKRNYKVALHRKYGSTTNSISWNERIAEVIGGEERHNDKF